ncbi:ZYRO0A08998p [Zygosaccharomyces rouxii]|uniref:ZYRO0A08998p n=1 Tax=Zygosaccharomyces rouxii (strain ATCC 2623 / CBS 732 / NBRC 1130 / NCYC 568 / NRRL Y-229) TaxID=559307 RepID=C5DQ65_ZYGRC|nr:uncharacterized protein ZYRO0A08998g [Zygosaccharomyces rouxii]KAH9198655.1 hypothetical protein LQ764DRAFT_235659 [Zygosaccharomyces rouxii]CAR25826.1 ZYRO0A08998p [Zygosaccharomyces rouxii]
MVRSRGLLRSELLKTDGSIDVNNIDVNDDDDDGIDVNRARQQREPIPMGFGYVPQMAQVGQGKIPGLPPGVPAGTPMGSPSPMPNPHPNPQQNMGFRQNGPMRMQNGMPYRGGPPMGGMPPNGMPPNGMPPVGVPQQPQQPQRRAYSLNNVWRQRPRISHKNNKKRNSGGNEDDEVIMQESEDDVTFNDIRTMGKSEKYGFGADTAPIIPTLITKSHNNMNNTEYRKAMTAQRKNAMNAMAKQRQPGPVGAVPAAGADPRAMSLQGYGRGSPFNPMGPGGGPGVYPGTSPGFGGNPRTPSGMPRSMSMMTTQSRPSVGYMRQHQQNMFAARDNEPPPGGRANSLINIPSSSSVGPSPNTAAPVSGVPGVAGPSSGSNPTPAPRRNLRLGINPPMPQSLDPGPLTPDNDQSKNVTSPLKNQLVAPSPGSPPINGGQLNVLQLSQPQQNELKEREKQLADRERELKEKEEMVKKREAEVQEELKQKEQELERERLRKDQEELQKQEQRELMGPSEENQQQMKTEYSSNVPLQNQSLPPQDLSRCNTYDGLDLQPSSTLERGLDGLSLNDKLESESVADNKESENGRERKTEKKNNKNPSSYNNRESTISFGDLQNNRISTSTFMSALSDSPQKKNKPATGLYQLENTGNNEFFTAEEFFGHDANTNQGNSTLDISNMSPAASNTTATLNSNARMSGQLHSDTPVDRSRNGPNRKPLSKIPSASSRENESGSGARTFSRNSVSNVSMGSFLGSNDDTFDFKHANTDRNPSVKSVPSGKVTKGSSVKQVSEQNPESLKEEDGEMEHFSFDNTMGEPYEPMFAHGSELIPPKIRFKTIIVSSDQLNILKENKSLMSEISIISAELADSIKRECILEEKLQTISTNRDGNDKPLSGESLLDYEAQLRTKSEKIVDLLKQLNEQRLRRLIAEEQIFLSENGAKPTSTDLVHKITDLESQLTAKDYEISRLREYQPQPF